MITYIPQSLWDAQDLVEMKARGEILFRTDNRKPLSLIRDTGGSAYNAADPSARPIWSPRQVTDRSAPPAVIVCGHHVWRR